MRQLSCGSGLSAYALALDPGDDVLQSLRNLLRTHDVRNGAVVSGIGTLDRCRMHMVTTTGMPPVEVFPEWNGVALELTSMQGIVASGEPHVHMTVSTPTGAIGGHLEEGCRVLYLAELTIVAFPSADLVRVPDAGGVGRLRYRGSPR